MSGFIDISGNYYEGEKGDINDLEVTERPSPYHIYSKKIKRWVVDEEAILNLKKRILNQLDEELRVKTMLTPLTSEQKKELTDLYNEKLHILSSSNDPIILQEIDLNY